MSVSILEAHEAKATVVALAEDIREKYKDVFERHPELNNLFYELDESVCRACGHVTEAQPRTVDYRIRRSGVAYHHVPDGTGIGEIEFNETPYNEFVAVQNGAQA